MRVGLLRGVDEQTGLFSCVSCEARVPADHALRLIRAVIDEALDVLLLEFDRLYGRIDRPDIAPRGCCGRCYCKRSTRCASSAS